MQRGRRETSRARKVNSWMSPAVRKTGREEDWRAGMEMAAVWESRQASPPGVSQREMIVEV
ncbi:hypothetical protein IEQ34_000262 [Dendrobium chrysotoxum]|uniref:Uncharacterized protein n=1 Tax=Dendrobium chrysotoxum TaxID=161865 RepID=A0AAV7HRX0_DENCH|nr:hypothetical protein IEQ34_000262 [Dendrobium chrysotoxum]